MIIAIFRILVGIAAMAALVAATFAGFTVLGTAALIARDRIEDTLHRWHKGMIMMASDINERDRERKERLARSRARGRENSKGKNGWTKHVDSYLPKKPYSEERAKPWDM